MRSSFAVSSWLSVFLSLAKAQNTFINPPPFGVIHDFSDNNIYPMGTHQTVAWKTEWEKFSLVLYQDGNSDFRYLPGSQNITIPSFPWTTGLVDGKAFDLKQGNVFFFAVFLAGSGSNPIQSHYFNITEEDTSSSSSSSTKTKATSSPTSSATSSTTRPAKTTAGSSSESSSSASPSSTSSSSSSNGTAVGLGVGLGVGLTLLAIVIGICTWIVLRRRRDQASPPYTQSIAAEPAYDYHSAYAQNGATVGRYAKVELAGNEPVHEMPGSGMR